MDTKSCFSLQVKYERDLLLMLILDENEFGPGAFERAVKKLKQGVISGVWWCDVEQTKANAIFLADGRKISIAREGGASWMEIGMPRIVTTQEGDECPDKNPL